MARYTQGEWELVPHEVECMGPDKMVALVWLANSDVRESLGLVDGKNNKAIQTKARGQNDCENAVRLEGSAVTC